MDTRLIEQKEYLRAMKSYVFTLYEIVLESRPKKMLEIGVQKGQSTKSTLLAMAENDFGKLISIDIKNRSGILDGSYSDLKKYWEFTKADSHSPQALQVAKNALEEGEYYDILFLDGDHKNPGVQQDWDDYTQLVKPGGIIIMHDIVNHTEDVKDVWKNITWEKFALDWGRSNSRIVPGLGLIKKPI